MRSFLLTVFTFPLLVSAQNADQEESDETLLSDWIDSLTLSDFVTVMLLTTFTLLIIWMVARTFRGKADV